jgi:uncharacterized protein (TIGR03435 family)
LILNCRTLTELIRDAYVTYANANMAELLRRIPISGGPDWIDSDRFTIAAKAEDTPSWGMMNGPMLQTVLEDRFRLKIHHESREVPVFALTVALGGLKMRPFAEGSCLPADFGKAIVGPLPAGVSYCQNRAYMSSPFPPAGPVYMAKTAVLPATTPPPPKMATFVIVDAQGMSLEDFVGIYLRDMGRPVIDKTGLSGRFDFHLEYTPGPIFPPLAASNRRTGRTAPPIFIAMEEQLGLKLEPDTGPAEFVIIDSVERPSGN